MKVMNVLALILGQNSAYINNIISALTDSMK
jgi:hypothetical protein